MLTFSGASFLCFVHVRKLDMVTKLGFRKTFWFIPQIKLTGTFYGCLHKQVMWCPRSESVGRSS